MNVNRVVKILSVAVFVLSGVACETTFQATLLEGAPSTSLPAADGIDPMNPNVERSTELVDFDGVDTVRVEIPTGRVTVSQSNGSGGALLKVTEFIVVKELNHEVLSAFLAASTVTAERSFVDDARLDIEATLAEGLADQDIVFDVRLVIPNGANVEVFLGNGPVDVIDITGNVEIRTASGAVLVDHVDGNVVALTSERPIRAIDVTGNVRAETSEGDITLRLAPPEDGMVSATTTEGDIALIIARTTSANLRLDATDGTVSANLGGFHVDDVATGNGMLRGILNGGGLGRIEARTLHGRISFAGM